MVEFALAAPVAIVVIFGTVVLATILLNQVQLSNAARDAARGAAICGSSTSVSGSSTALPDGSGLCTTAAVDGYITNQLSRVQSCPQATCWTLKVVDQSGTLVAGPGDAANLSSCVADVGAATPDMVAIHATYQVPLYMPMLGYVFGNGGSNTRTVNADAEATCEQ